jgi:GNAT superfamily N-acetyltransferase
LRAVYVSGEFAKLGLGKAILNVIEKRALELGLSKLSMHSSLTAEPFYLKNGYRKLDEITHTLSTGVQMRAVAMTKSLK